jgi:hypothetical protein
MLRQLAKQSTHRLQARVSRKFSPTLHAAARITKARIAKRPRFKSCIETTPYFGNIGVHVKFVNVDVGNLGGKTRRVAQLHFSAPLNAAPAVIFTGPECE